MEFTPNNPPRSFVVGRLGNITLNDCAHIRLDPDEQVTFITPAGAEYDVVRKSWGFYATPSLNRRMAKFGWRSALVQGFDGKVYVILVERGKEHEFRPYAAQEQQTVLSWLDSDEDIRALRRALGKDGA